jgi:hypothetical protein
MQARRSVIESWIDGQVNRADEPSDYPFVRS